MLILLGRVLLFCCVHRFSSCVSCPCVVFCGRGRNREKATLGEECNQSGKEMIGESVLSAKGMPSRWERDREDVIKRYDVGWWGRGGKLYKYVYKKVTIQKYIYVVLIYASCVCFL